MDQNTAEEQQPVTISPGPSVEAVPAKARRKYKYFVMAYWARVDEAGTERVETQVFEFDTMAAMCHELSEPKFGDAEFRVIRGYEMEVQTKRRVDIR